MNVASPARASRRGIADLSFPAALGDLWKSESVASFVRGHQVLSRLDKVVKAVGKVYRSTMRDYGFFHEFLRAVDFAGKFYRREMMRPQCSASLRSSRRIK